MFRYDFINPVTTFAGGFSNLIDIAAGPDEALYLLQYSDDFFGPPSGRVLRLGLDGSVRSIFDDLVSPTGLAVGRDGTINVANDGDGVNGELLALNPARSATARRPAPPATASALDRPSPGG